MLRCALDTGIERIVVGGFAMPLGVKPTEPIHPAPGYVVDFEAADGDDEEGDWEAWPDRYVFEATISAKRLPALCRMLFALLPGRVYPILDFLGHDAHREIDPYIAYEPVGLDRFLEGLSAFAPFLFEDGMCGFGAMCDRPFIYIFVDEHKVLTLRVEARADGRGRERIERVLSTFGLTEIEEPAGVDAAAHEHRSVLVAPSDRADLLTAEEIVEVLRDHWQLTLNVDADQNLDDDGKELGLTHWRCLVRCSPAEDGVGARPSPPVGGRYAEVLLTADCLGRAEEMALDEVERLVGGSDPAGEIVTADRVTGAQMAELLAPMGQSVESPAEERIFLGRWLE